MKTPFRLRYALALFAAAFLLDLATPAAMDQEDPALCGTDTECLQHCPPPMDDPDCDGGPQSQSPWRQYRATVHTAGRA